MTFSELVSPPLTPTLQVTVFWDIAKSSKVKTHLDFFFYCKLMKIRTDVHPLVFQDWQDKLKSPRSSFLVCLCYSESLCRLCYTQSVISHSLSLFFNLAPWWKDYLISRSYKTRHFAVIKSRKTLNSYIRKYCNNSSIH